MTVELRQPPFPVARSETRMVLLFIGLQLATLVGLLVLAVAVFYRPNPTTSADGALFRKVASQLKSAGALEEAAALYTKYLEVSSETKKTKASVAYSIGVIYLEQGRYEKALRFFYQAQAFDQNAVRQEVGDKIVHCLERLGHVHAAKAALATWTDLDGGEQPSRALDDKVVAKIGKKEILLSDLQKRLDQLPPQIAEHVTTPEQREAFLRKFVADVLIAQKATKLEYDKKPEVRQKMETMFQEIMVNAFVENEILNKLTINEEDLKNHFQAHRERYNQPEAVKARWIKVQTMEKAKQIENKLGKGAAFESLAAAHSLDMQSKETGGLVQGWITKDRDFLQEGDFAGVAKALFQAKNKSVVGPIAAGAHVHLFKIEAKRPPQTKSFKEVHRQVEQDYRLMKIQAAYQKLIESELSVEDVELYPETLSALK